MQEEAAQKEKLFLTGRQVAWMFYECSKVSDTDDSVLDFNYGLNVELKNENVQSSNTRWDDAIVAMKMQPDHDFLGKCV